MSAITNDITTTASSAATSSTSKTAAATDSNAVTADRFLKLLVAQMKNQDPMNPMDNAEVTTQMAQINTVTGLDKVNTSVQSLSTQFSQMQALQGASLVGHDVVIPGDHLSVSNGVATGSFELAGNADTVNVTVTDALGNQIDTFKLDKTQTLGRHSFTWDASGQPANADLHFKVDATNQTKAVDATLLMTDRVQSVTTGGTGLTLQLAYSGNINYTDIKSIN